MTEDQEDEEREDRHTHVQADEAGEKVHNNTWSCKPKQEAEKKIIIRP
jgi:hypothetical protein